MKVAVTGASGFIGRQAVRALQSRGAEVLALSRGEAPDWLPKGVEWRSADLFDQQAVSGIFRESKCDRLLHSAWIATPGIYWTSPDNALWVDASERLFRAFAEAGGRRLVSVGTCAEYNPPAHGPCEPFSTPLRALQPYSEAKIETSKRLDALAGEIGLVAAWARIFFLYGPHENPQRLVPNVARNLLAGREVLTSHGRQIRDFMDVRDCGAALAATVLSDIEGPLNISTGDPVELRQVVETLGAVIGRSDLLRIGARPAPADEAPNLWGSAARLRDEVGFRGSLDLEAGLRSAVDYWKTQKVS